MAGASSIAALPPASTIHVFSGPNGPLGTAEQDKKRVANTGRIFKSFIIAEKAQLTLPELRDDFSHFREGICSEALYL
jgi:hypothetical protein